MIKVIGTAILAGAAAVGFAASPAFAGSPHFVGDPAYTTSGSTVTVSAKEAGLGGEAQIHVVLTGTAECVNGGGKSPSPPDNASFTTAAHSPASHRQSASP